MKLGLGLYRHMLAPENYRFARQCGCTHVVAHYVDYFNQGLDNERENQPTGGPRGWGLAGDADRIWTYEELQALKQQINAEGLELAAIENFDPAHWYDVLLREKLKRRCRIRSWKISRQLSAIWVERAFRCLVTTSR